MSGNPRIAVIGAGPAGLRAVETLAKAGLRPVLVDEAPRPGGQIYRQPPAGADRAAETLYGLEAGKARALYRLLADLDNAVEYRPSTLAWNVFENTIDLLGPDGFERLAFDRLVLATGAMDRILPFPGWAIPGVFTLGAAQIALKGQGVSIGRRVALVGAGPLLPLVTRQYRRAGAERRRRAGCDAVLDQAHSDAGTPRLAGDFVKGVSYTLRSMTAG